MPKAITVEQILSWKPCPQYTPERVSELIGDGKTPLEILDLDIPIYDKFWVVLQEEIIPARELRLLACDFAERVLPIFEQKFPLDKRPRNAIEVARRYANGEATEDELVAARAPTWAAARSASDAALAAWAAARSAACAAAWDASWAASYAAMAARSSARDAAIAAALTEEASAQLEMVREVLRKIKERANYE